GGNHGSNERTPEDFSRVQRLRSTTLHRLSARRASRLIANSRNTRTDLAAFFGVPERDIDVVYPAASPAFFAEPDSAAVKGEVERVFGECVPFFIFVGKLSRRRHLPPPLHPFARPPP